MTLLLVGGPAEIQPLSHHLDSSVLVSEGVQTPHTSNPDKVCIPGQLPNTVKGI